mgnify:CR=1 FL=1
MKERKCILFDLDGTLSDPGEGIINSLIHALKHFGIEGDPAILRKFIGPPLTESFKEHFNFDDEQTAEAIRIYRKYFHDHGVLKNEIYPGIPELLQDLALPVSEGVRHRQSGLLQALEQADQKRQIRRWATLDQGQDIFAMLGGNEEVAVLGAPGDAAEVDQPPQFEALQKRLQFAAADRGEHRHLSPLPLEDLPGGNTHALRAVGTGEVAVIVHRHQEVGRTPLRNHLDGVEKTIEAVFLDGLVTFLADGYIRLTGQRRLLRHRSHAGHQYQRSQCTAYQACHGNLVPN